MATVITNATQLQNMENDLTADYELGNDIDASATPGWNGGLGFDPIGDNATPFTGNFNGKSYKITGLFIDRPLENDVALFGEALAPVSIQNVSLISCSIVGDGSVGSLVGGGLYTTGLSVVANCFATGVVTGGASVGGLMAVNTGTVSDCYSEVVVVGTHATLRIQQVGGLVGYNHAIIIRSYATGRITITASAGEDISQIGGLVGFHNLSSPNAKVSQSFASGDVLVNDGSIAVDDIYGIGGLIGSSDAPVSDCYAKGDITVKAGVGPNPGLVGGFVGENIAAIDNGYSTGLITTVGMSDVGGFCGENFSAITDSFWDTETSGKATSDGGTGKTTAQMKTKSTFTDAGWDFGTPIWGIIPSINNGYPYFGPSLSDQDSVDQTIIGNKVSLEAIRNIEIVYGGRFYISKSGLAIYESRYHRNV